MSKNEKTTDITVKATHHKKPLFLRTHIGDGNLGEIKFELSSTMGGALYVSIDGNPNAVVLDVQSFVRAAIDVLEKEVE